MRLKRAKSHNICELFIFQKACRRNANTRLAVEFAMSGGLSTELVSRFSAPRRLSPRESPHAACMNYLKEHRAHPNTQNARVAQLVEPPAPM